MQLPKKSRYIIIGAGVHGLSTAYHLALELKASGKGSGSDILIVDKTGIAAGASGIACGVVRNNYFQPAMGELMRVSVEVWESDKEAYHYNPVGYMALGPSRQDSDLEATYDRQRSTNYPSALISGEQAVFRYMKSLYPDWKARGLTTLLHEYKGGYAFNKESMHGIANKAIAEGVQIVTGVEVTGFARPNGRVTAVRTDQGDIETDQVVVAVGPWVKSIWGMLDLPMKIDVKDNDGNIHRDRDMWTYWRLQEGEIEFDLNRYLTADGDTPAVIHVDSTEPLISLSSGKVIEDEFWGIYYKPDRHGVQGGAVPDDFGTDAQVDPYGIESPHYVVDENFIDYWTAGLGHCMGRFENAHAEYKHIPSGGIGAFTVDNFPVFDMMLPNVYVIADSNHGYKMIGVGKEVAKNLMGEQSTVLHPFRFSRYAEGALHPTSNSPFPWS